MTFDPKDSASYLRSVATHHVHSHEKWGWTRNHGIKQIKMEKTGHRAESLRYRLRSTVSGVYRLFFRGKSSSFSLFESKSYPQNLSLPRKIKYRWYAVIATIRVRMGTGGGLPDGSFPAGVIAYWEEDGEYIQVMQPSVGALLAEFLEAEPENPHAVKISEEIASILVDYQKRIASGKSAE